MNIKTMATINTKRLRELHETGMKGIFKILTAHRTFKKAPFYMSIIVSLAACVILLVNKADLIKILSGTSALIQTVFPGLLGFSLGGYAIAVGFSNTELIKQATKLDKHNVYQILSGIFALSILIQVVATIIGLLVYWCLSVNISSALNIHVPTIFAKAINSILLFTLFFSSLYSLILVPYVVINLFTLSQLNSLYFTIEKNKES